MCGISGTVKSEEAPLTKYDVREAHKSWALAETRGGHAVGCTTDTDLFWASGSLKAAKRTKAWKGYKKGIVGSACVLQHNRFATRGSAKNLKNNHPIQGGLVGLTHNGIVSSKAFDKTPNLTDTTILVHAWEHYLNAGLDTFSAFAEGMKYVDGTYAVAAVRYATAEVLLAKGPSDPLVVAITEEGRIRYASTLRILKVRKNEECFDLEDGEALLIDLADGSYFWEKFTPNEEVWIWAASKFWDTKSKKPKTKRRISPAEEYQQNLDYWEKYLQADKETEEMYDLLQSEFSPENGPQDDPKYPFMGH